ncbi:hypothetical protein STEG23_007545 [Scotinomys teguina]
MTLLWIEGDSPEDSWAVLSDDKLTKSPVVMKPLSSDKWSSKSWKSDAPLPGTGTVSHREGPVLHDYFLMALKPNIVTMEAACGELKPMRIFSHENTCIS